MSETMTLWGRLLQRLPESPIVTQRACRRRTKNAFELGYDAGQARLRELLVEETSR